jgi:hypothetical protein
MRDLTMDLTKAAREVCDRFWEVADIREQQFVELSPAVSLMERALGLVEASVPPSDCLADLQAPASVFEIRPDRRYLIFTKLQRPTRHEVLDRIAQQLARISARIEEHPQRVMFVLWPSDIEKVQIHMLDEHGDACEPLPFDDPPPTMSPDAAAAAD